MNDPQSASSPREMAGFTPTLNPTLDEIDPSPFARLEEVRADLRRRNIEIIDFTVGDPKERTPPFIKDALIDALPERSSYPSISGLPELREAISEWFGRRFGVELDPSREILPANGSKEAIYHLATLVIDRKKKKRRVVIPTPAYPVYWRSALLAGGIPTALPLDPANGFLPRVDQLPEEIWQETALLWINTPHNPTGAIATEKLLGEYAGIARDQGFVVASDEAYSEIYSGSPPPSLLHAGMQNSLVFHSLSKRSAMTGYRTGFVAGQAELIARYRELRPTLGVATPEFVQRAAIRAWRDEEHVQALRESFQARRKLFLGCLQRAGIENAGGEGTFFLWVRAPGGDDVGLAESWFAAGVLTIPGSWFGESGKGYLRVALVPTLEECSEAARRIESL